MQKIILRGRLGKDSETFPFGERQALKFPLACDHGRGETVKTTWYDIVFFRTQLQQYLTKGKELIISGRLDVRKSEGKDGRTYVNLTVYADDLEFIGKSSSQGNSQDQSHQQPRQQEPQQEPQVDDGLPF